MTAPAPKKKKWKRHFPGTTPNTIHTSRSPKCFRKAACEYQNRARMGPVAGYGGSQDHHIVPVGTMIRYQDPKESYKGYIVFIDAAYRNQDYCSNNKANLWWLPTKATYLAKPKANPVWDLNLPCHNIGHAAYFKEVLIEMRRQIWNPLKKSKDDPKNCPTPPTLVTIVFTALESDFWRRLKYRGLRPGLMGGTRYAVDNQGKGTNWWHAFSMADTPDCTEAVTTFITKEIPAALIRP